MIDTRILALRGRAVPVRGDDIDTDRIIPARFLRCVTFDGLGAQAFRDERFDEQGREKDHPFNKARYQGSEILVVNRNFGCGSSREHAPIAVKASGVGCVIAHSFARIFYRNAFNMGLLILECPEAAESIVTGDEIEVDPDRGVIVNHTQNKTYHAQPIPPFMQDLVRAGGLMPYVKEQAQKQSGA